MELRDKVVVVTGAASGIGRALARRFHAEGARAVVVADLDGAGAARGGRRARRRPARRPRSALAGDVGIEAETTALIERTETTFGPIDLFFANAGVGPGADLDTPDDDWATVFDVNVDAHRWAARRLRARLAGRAARATSARPRRPPACSPRSARRRTRSPSTPPSRSPSGSVDHLRRPRHPVSAACARWASTRTCSTPATTLGGGDAGNVVRSAGDVLEPERRRRGRGRRHPRRDVPHPAAPRGAHLPAAQDRRLRPLAGRDAPAAGPDGGRPVGSGRCARPLAALGLRRGDRVRFRQRHGRPLDRGRASRDGERDGSIRPARRQGSGAVAIAPRRLEVRRPGSTWAAALDHRALELAVSREQLALCRAERWPRTLRRMGVRLDPSDEYMHELGPEPNFNESMYINCFDPDHRSAAGSAWATGPTRARRDDGLPLPPGRPRCGFMFKRPTIANNDALDAGGLHVDDGHAVRGAAGRLHRQGRAARRPDADGRPEGGVHQQPVRRVRGRT